MSHKTSEQVKTKEDFDKLVSGEEEASSMGVSLKGWCVAKLEQMQCVVAGSGGGLFCMCAGGTVRPH